MMKPTLSSKRVFQASHGLAQDGNVRARHPADRAAWIWHPDCRGNETAFLRFGLDVDCEQGEVVFVHVSADQRFQLSVDGQPIGFGPDRSEVEEWAVASYELRLPSGSHRIEALVWWIADGTLTGLRTESAQTVKGKTGTKPPIAQATWRGGFVFACDGAAASRFNTGLAPWWVQDLSSAVEIRGITFFAYHDIGPEFWIDGTKWGEPHSVVPAQVVVSEIPGNIHGVRRPGWRLEPTILPEQERVPVSCGRLRAVLPDISSGPFMDEAWDAGEGEAWNALLLGAGSVTVPPRSQRTILWDFADYICGYARLKTRGGLGSRVRIDWAESLYEAESVLLVDASTRKGDRNRVAGKVFFGFGDEFSPTEGAVSFPSFWWRAGRFLRITVTTSETALELVKLTVCSTGYPLGNSEPVSTDDAGLNAALARAEKTMRACAHEVWCDCPYYEQMAYTGDVRLAALGNYALFADDRLSRRMLTQFDASRRQDGLVAERTPSAWAQVSPTYSLLWVLMVRDFAWWRDDRAYVVERLRGVRAMLGEVAALTDTEGRLGLVPGWPFVDWVPTWNQGCGPGVREGDSSIVNLHLLLALQAQVELETHFGEAELAALAKRRAENLGKIILTRYWSPKRGLLADTSAFDAYSEHAQALGILAGLVPPGGVETWANTWLRAEDLAEATIYFSFYVMDALWSARREKALFQRIRAWSRIAGADLITLPEAPEPTRSDCHGWSGHARWHATASLAGIRPTAPGFARVIVAPQLGDLTEIRGAVAHPRGAIDFVFFNSNGDLQGEVVLPDGVSGELHWNKRNTPLYSGKNLL